MKSKARTDRKGVFTGITFLALALAISAHAGAKAESAKTAKTAKADSLHTLRIMLSSEVKTGNEVLILKNPAVTDSLLRNPSPRETFLRGIEDSSLARPVRTPEEFSVYWNRIEKENGISALQSQMAAHDVDKSRIPKAYLFDSSVVVYPGWIIVRHRLHRK